MPKSNAFWHGINLFTIGVFETMQTEIVLEAPDATVVFMADLEVYAPNILCIDNTYYYHLTGVANHSGILSAVYKPATIVYLPDPQNAQVFKKAK